MPNHLCVGGPLNGQETDYVTAHGLGYTSFNCAGSRNRTKIAYKRAAAKGEVIPPSSIFVHRSCFEGGGFPFVVEPQKQHGT